VTCFRILRCFADLETSPLQYQSVPSPAGHCNSDRSLNQGVQSAGTKWPFTRMRTCNDKSSRRLVPFIRHTARSMRFPTLKPQDRASEIMFGPRITDVRPPPDHALSPSSPESSHINLQRSSSWFVNSNVTLCYIEWNMRMTRMVLFDKMLHVPETLPSTPPPPTTSLWTSISSNLSPSPHRRFSSLCQHNLRLDQHKSQPSSAHSFLFLGPHITLPLPKKVVTASTST
jgi:hypothetical protein